MHSHRVPKVNFHEQRYEHRNAQCEHNQNATIQHFSVKVLHVHQSACQCLFAPGGSLGSYSVISNRTTWVDMRRTTLNEKALLAGICHDEIYPHHSLVRRCSKTRRQAVPQNSVVPRLGRSVQHRKSTSLVTTPCENDSR